MKNIFIIVQARMTSTRLPQKVMLPLFDNMSVLEIFLKRLNKYKENIIVATTDDNTSKPIVKLCNNLNMKVYQGSMNNVLKRYYDAGKYFGILKNDIVVRICSDSPCIDIDIVDKVIENFKINSFDYVSNDTSDGTPKGLNVEVFRFETLERSYLYAKTDFEKEHVTPYIRDNMKVGKIKHKYDHKDISLTIDTIEDYEYLKNIFEKLGTINFNYEQLIKVVKEL